MSKEKEYTDPLNSFESKILISTSHYDIQVGYVSSAITHYNPYEQSEFGEFGYKMLNVNNEIPDYKKGEMNEFIIDNYSNNEIHVEMLENLKKINWEKYDIEFNVDRFARKLFVHEMIIKIPTFQYVHPIELIQTTKKWLNQDFLNILQK